MRPDEQSPSGRKYESSFGKLEISVLAGRRGETSADDLRRPESTLGYGITHGLAIDAGGQATG